MAAGGAAEDGEREEAGEEEEEAPYDPLGLLQDAKGGPEASGWRTYARPVWQWLSRLAKVERERGGGDYAYDKWCAPPRTAAPREREGGETTQIPVMLHGVRVIELAMQGMQINAACRSPMTAGALAGGSERKTAAAAAEAAPWR